MIGKLRGKVGCHRREPCHHRREWGRYEVQASARTLRNFQLGADVSLSIETYVREDAIRLFGFTSEVERAWFRTLQTVQGIGSKVALAVLGTMSTQDLANCDRARQLGGGRSISRGRQEAGAAHRVGIEGEGAGPVSGSAAGVAEWARQWRTGSAARGQRCSGGDLGIDQSLAMPLRKRPLPSQQPWESWGRPSMSPA